MKAVYGRRDRLRHGVQLAMLVLIRITASLPPTRPYLQPSRLHSFFAPWEQQYLVLQATSLDASGPL